jgi:putative oxidoreductase
MFHRLVRTRNDWHLTVARVLLGVVFFAHGAQKLLGWFGGPGYTAAMGTFTHAMGIPAVFAFLAIVAGFFGGIGLIVGLLGRVAAFGIFCEMLVAVAKVHAPNGFFMNWTGTQKGEGIEFHLLALALCAAVMMAGSGALSVDLALSRRGAAPGAATRPQPRAA